MDIRLRPFLVEDLQLLPRWAQAIGASEYLSRIRPRDPGAQAHDPAQGLHGFVIQVEGADVGTLWLERGDPPGCRVLGIFLGSVAYLGQGIGTRAIKLALSRLEGDDVAVERVLLNVRAANARAIACYLRCGFRVTGSGSKVLPGGATVPVLRMERERALPGPARPCVALEGDSPA